MYKLKYSLKAEKILKKIKKKDLITFQKIKKTTFVLIENPFDKKLKSHKVTTKNFGLVWSSRINKDLRIIWNFTKQELTILVLTFGSHNGKAKVYK